MTPLHWAAYCGHEKTVELLVEKGASTTARDDNGRIPLHLAAVAGTLTTRIAHLLKANKKDFAASDRRGLTALHFTAMAGKMESTRFILVGESANVKPTNSSSQTALSNTVENDHTESQADVNAKDRNGSAPLHWAAAEGHEATARTLIVEGKADVNAKDKDGQTPLYQAAANGHEAAARTLIVEGKADVNAGDNNGRTPLHVAAAGGHEATARALIVEFKADVGARDNDGRTPLDRAFAMGHEATARTLIGYGAVVPSPSPSPTP